MSSVPAAPRAVIASRSDVDLRDPDEQAALVALEQAVADVASASDVPSARFPREARMLLPREFDRCMQRPAFHRSGAFALHLCRVDASTVDPHWRLGLVIPKRYEASAVARNTIKRRWRDSFRRGRVAWAAEFGSVDVVVRLQGPLIPKAPRPARKAGKADAAASAVKAIAPPAKVRARERFDPVALFAQVVDRLRRRGGRAALPPAVAAEAS